MKTAPSRSPSRRSSPPPPPRMSHRSPGFRRGRSPERRRRVDSQSGVGGGRMSPPRSRERREFGPSPRSQPPDFAVPRRSRSPLRESKRRSFSPKRRSKSPKRERREQERERSARPTMSRKRSRSKSPPVVGPPLHEGTSRLGPYSGPTEGPPGRTYQGPESYTSAEPVLEVEHSGRSISALGERFPEPSRGTYEEEHPERPVFRGPDRSTRELEKITVDGHSDRPVFRGPDGTGYDINELKKITVDIRRNLPITKTRNTERTVLNPEDVVLVRRPETSLDGEYTAERSRRVSRDRYGRDRSPSSKSRRRLSPWEQEEAINLNHHRNKSEGSRPIFAREEILQANERSKYDPGPSSYEHRSVGTDEHQRVVAIIDNPHTQTSGGGRFESPGRYSAPTTYYGGDREHGGSSRDYGRSRDERSHGPGSSFEPRDKNRDDHFERREDLRHDLELRHRELRYREDSRDGVRLYDKGRDYRENERGSDLRTRIHEKRSDRHDDHDMGHRHPMDRYEMERERDRDRRMQPSPPGDRRRGPMEYRRMGDGERKMRGDMHMGPGSHGPSGRRNDASDRFHQDPEFGPRPDRFHGSKPWDVNPEYVPKGRAYFEHDNRDETRMPNRGRGTMGMRGQFRGRGMMRGRPFRGAGQTRGYMGGRGTGRRGGYIPRFKQSSPHWEHDLFDNTSPGHGNNGFSK